MLKVPSRFRLVAVPAALTCVALVGLLGVASAQAAPGDLDPTFSGDGKALASFGVSDGGNEVALQSDGKIVVVGDSYADGKHHFALARFNPDGSLDASFGVDGKVTTDGGGSAAYDVALQSDGKIVAVGHGSDGFVVARYNREGSLDDSFGVAGKVTTDFGGSGWAMGVRLQPDGKIVAAGHGSRGFAMARYNPNGSLDDSFGVAGKVTTDFNGDGAIALQDDGKIVGVGSAPGLAGYSDLALARYNANGSLDTSFGQQGMQITDVDWGGDDTLADVAIGPDGTIATVGQSYCFICSSTTLVVAVYARDGSPRGLHMAGVSGTDSGSSIAFQSDGKIVAAGGTIDDFLVARYDSAGNPDPSFHDDGVYTNLGVRTTDFGGSDGAGGVAVQPDGKIVAAGTSVTYRPDGSAAGRFAIARYEAGPAPINLRPPAISGTAAAGQTLTALPGDWTDSTEPSSYQWLMCDANGTGCANIAGATTNKYVLAAADVGLRIRVRETASNANGSSSAESAATPEVSGTVVNLRPPAISGTPTEGQTLTVTPGTWSTTNNITRTLQWRRCDRSGANCLDIAGASSSSYVLLAPDVDHTIRVRETATRTATGVQSSADSAATPVVRAKPGEIAGTVRNRKTGGAIANATVNCGSGYSANTNSGGAFLITAVTAPASYRCTASATGYLSSAAQRVTVSAGETATVAFSLARQ